MTKDEFVRLEGIINTTMGKASFLQNQDIEDTFFNFCVRYPYDLSRKAILDLIENEAYDTEGRRVPLSLYQIERKIEREWEIRKAQERKPEERTCPNCKNQGYILITYPTKVDYFRACSCSIGREKYPWYFMGPAERQSTMDEGSRRSWASYDSFRAPEEFHRQAKYGR